MQKLKFSINGTKYEATVAEKEHNVAEVELNGKKYVVEVERAESVAMPHLPTPKHTPAAQATVASAAPKAAASANSITAPLPGSITAVNVKAGDAVKAGDTLLIIEAMKMENEVMAPADGTVKEISDKNSTSGKTVVIDHGNGYQTSYGHLLSILVRRGQRVHRGDLIALSGNSGLSLAPHLHYEVRYNGIRVDPIHYFFMELSPDEYQRIIRISQSGMQSFD